MKPEFRKAFWAGIEYFNARRFWEAHEAWEELWLQAESDAHQFLQGMIQLAAAYHHLQRGTFPGAVRLFEAGLHKMAPYPPLYCGIDRDALVTLARQHQSWAHDKIGERSTSSASRLTESDYPTIRLAEDWASRIPPSEKW